MKTVRHMISVLAACAFLVMGTVAHGGIGTGVDDHAIQIVADDGVDRESCHTAEDGVEVEHPVNHDAHHCCTTGGGCGFIVSTVTATMNERIEFTEFTTIVRCGSSCVFPPESPPPLIPA